MDRTHDPTRAPALATRPVVSRTQPAIYYRDNGTYVTEDWLIVAGRRYQVNQLANLRTVRAAGSPVTRGAAAVAVFVALAILLVARYLSTAAWIGAGIVLAVPLVVLAGELLRTHRRYELWADYRGLTVQVLCEQSAEHVEGVCRALRFAQR
ncbi:MAG TPA: DUF6232 family protein [Rugosimonospora sp.]|nr:DUF6232 family protein [Rugosimonospora sp.]